METPPPPPPPPPSLAARLRLRPGPGPYPRDDPSHSTTPKSSYKSPATTEPSDPDPKTSHQPQRTTLLSMPTEIHLAIAQYLIYPDALSLKHTNAYFYSFVDTGIQLKVAWLVERRSLHLECPNTVRCDLGSDLKFCRGSVPLLMQRRREHVECESRPGVGCLVFGTSTCTHRPKPSARWRRWLQAKVTVELWWFLVVLVPVVVSWLCKIQVSRLLAGVDLFSS